MVTSQLLYYGFLTALAGERLVELSISRRNARLAHAGGAHEVGQSHFRIMVLIHATFFVACAAEVYLLGRRPPGVLAWIAVGATLAAQALRYWVVYTLGARWNVRIIVWPDLPPVTHGPYRFVRHPNYVAVILEMLFVPLVHGAYWTGVVFSLANAAILRVRVRAEERALGEAYEAAFGRRPRFLPGALRV
jgi:methyltransferase